jgi:hypothetical protein
MILISTLPTPLIIKAILLAIVPIIIWRIFESQKQEEYKLILKSNTLEKDNSTDLESIKHAIKELNYILISESINKDNFEIVCQDYKDNFWNRNGLQRSTTTIHISCKKQSKELDISLHSERYELGQQKHHQKIVNNLQQLINNKKSG